MTPADQHALREALARAVGAVPMSNGDDPDPGVLSDWIPDGCPGVTDWNNLLAVADTLIAGPLAPYLSAKAERDATAKRDAHEFALRSEAPGDPWEMVRHLEEQCRLFIRERDEWKAVADRDRAARLAAETKLDVAATTLAECEAQLPTLPGTGGDMVAFSISSRIASIAREAMDGREGERIASARALATEAENTRLKETVEAARKAHFESLREARCGFSEIHDGLADYTRPKQSSGEVCAYWRDRFAEEVERHTVLATIPPKENP